MLRLHIPSDVSPAWGQCLSKWKGQHIRVDEQHGMISYIQEDLQGGFYRFVPDGLPVCSGLPQRHAEVQLMSAVCLPRLHEH